MRYYCNSGYRLSGSATVTCLAIGVWSTRPTCQREKCYSACTCIITFTLPINSYSLLLVITFFKTTCILILAVSCGTPPGIVNGHYGTPTRTTYGGTVRYYCYYAGYRLSGSATVSCLASGVWSTQPTCQRKYCMHVRIIYVLNNM